MTTTETIHPERYRTETAEPRDCAGSLFVERLHDVTSDDAAYTLIGPGDRRWLFCSRTCLVGWCELVADGTLDGGR